MSGYVQTSEKLLLAFRSGGRCARCREVITVEATGWDPAKTLGFAAHIKGENGNSARYDASQPDSERNVYGNLVYLCGNCHSVIDKQEKTYPVALLLDMKNNHEKWVNAKLRESSVAVGFSELDVIAKAILGQPHNPTLDFTVIGPAAKMKKNGLGIAVLEQLKMGYGKAPEVKKYVDHVALIDVDFPERLKSGFAEQYNTLRAQGLSGDTLFFALRDFASKGSIEFTDQAAALSILSYLFQNCEVFER